MASLPRFRRILTALAVAAALGLAAIVVLAVIGIPIDVAPWRERLSAAATDALARPVAFEGPIELRLSLHPSLRVGGVRVDNPPGFASREFARLGDVRIELALAPALRGALRFRAIEARDARIRVERTVEGKVNWQFGALGSAREPEPTRASPVSDDGRALHLEVGRIDIRNVALEYFDAVTNRSRFFDLDELTEDSQPGQPVALRVRGRVDKSFPYALSLAGDSGDPLFAGEPWPFTLDFEFLGTRLHAAGTLNRGRDTSEVQFGLGTENLAELERFLQTRLPAVGVAALSGTIVARPERFEIASLRGVMGESRFDGAIELALAAGRVQIRGALSFAELDVRPFLAPDPTRNSEPLTYAEIENRPIDLAALRAVDADLTVTVARLLGVRLDIRDTRLGVRVAEGALTAPIETTLADVRLAGAVAVNAAAPAPALSLALSASNSALGNLAQALTGLRGIDGTLGQFSLAVGGQGDTVGVLVRDLDLAVRLGAAKLSYGNLAGGRPVEFTFDSLDATIPRGGRLSASARGRLLGEPFTAQAKGGELDSILRTLRSPLELTLRGAGADVRVAGRLARPESNQGSDVEIAAKAPRIGSLARWLGVSPKATLPLSLRARVRLESDEAHVSDAVLKVGRSEIFLDAHQTGLGTKPFVLASVRSPLIDAVELATLRPESAAGARRDERAVIDLPVLPKGVSLADADIGVGLERVAFSRTALTNAGFAARLRDGHMAASPWAATLAEVPFSGDMRLDLRGDAPEAGLTLATGKVDIGALLRRLGIANGIEASAAGLRAQATLQGSRLGELAERSSFEGTLAGGRLRIPGAAGKTLADIAVREAALGAAPGGPIAVRIEGELDATPITAYAWSGSLPELLRDAGTVPYSARAEAAGARLAVDGTVKLPFGQGGANLTLDVSGERLDTLSPLARAELPPWGPWSVSGPFRITSTAYEVPKLAVRVGSSRLDGRARVDVAGARPRLDMRIAAPQIQLDDFRLPERAPDPDAKQLSPEEVRARAKAITQSGQSFASAAVLRRFDAFVDVQVEQVLSGKDRLGDGRLVAQVSDGRASLGPAIVNVTDGGTMTLTATYEPTATDVSLAVGAFVEKFDYGVLARRAKPGASIEGTFSLRVELASRAPALEQVMAHANGSIDVAVWPKSVAAGVFDLWAVNVFAALIPEVDPAATSRVNCAVGRFDLRDGVLKQDAILIDTTRMRVTGEGGVDFRDETLGFRLQPRAKEPQLFSLATPVQVSGTLADPKVGASAGAVLGSIARFVGSAVLFPLYLLPQGKVPSDGTDICADPIRATEATKK
ncbi:MAG: AsmA family protein [Burkholderiales bacterium]|jgi:hypothetical protein|nr:AsmA family protein [Burkholderiales bacterium]